MHRFGRVAVAGVLCGSAALGVATVAQASPGKGPGHQKAFNGNAHLIHVGLNPATCGTVPGTKSARSTCTATRHATARGSTSRCTVRCRTRPTWSTFAVWPRSGRSRPIVPATVRRTSRSRPRCPPDYRCTSTSRSQAAGAARVATVTPSSLGRSTSGRRSRRIPEDPSGAACSDRGLTGGILAITS